MAAPNFEAGRYVKYFLRFVKFFSLSRLIFRLGERGIETTRMLERILKESTCLDVESLCIIAGEKVTVHVLCWLNESTFLVFFRFGKFVSMFT